ncbi:putative glycoporin [Vibrio ishigakensis]|uniref:Putative glycoporin n=1 Tax=Vibrio ishigakensis TaxID=1481914 RepID=A0A0B8PJD0_9VIBR|nr:putative glycoporin [Vibrio ishigakensis]GAM68148.1 glycoporin [Vibrio sp. JCM 19236]
MKNTFKLSLAAILVSSAMTANAGISIVDSEEGNFSIGGNVELNFNYQDREMMDDSEFNQDGRVLIEFAGEKYTDAGYYVGVKAQHYSKVLVTLHWMTRILNSVSKTAGQFVQVVTKHTTCSL